MIDKILENNHCFVAGKGYEKHITDGKPSGKTLIVTCMDTRLSVMLPEALGIKEIMLIHHTDCGAGKMTGEHMEHLIRERNDADKVAEVEQHINLRQWLDGFGDTEKSVRATMHRVKNHPLVPKDIIVRGFIIDSTTGALTEVTE